MPTSDNISLARIEIERVKQSEHIDSTLNLSNLELTTEQLKMLAPDIGKLKNVTTLDFSNLRLTTEQLNILAPEIGKLRNVKTLNLSNNEFTALVTEIAQLPILFNLNLSNNKFTKFPQEIVQLSSLLNLNFRNNNLTALSPEIRQLTNILDLDISNNNFTIFPGEIIQLSSLQILNLENNELTALPQEIGALINLYYLNLSNNKFTALTPEITNLPMLDDSSRKVLEDYSKQIITGEYLKEVIENSSDELKALTLVLNHHYSLQTDKRDFTVPNNEDSDPQQNVVEQDLQNISPLASMQFPTNEHLRGKQNIPYNEGSNNYPQRNNTKNSCCTIM